MKSILTDFLIKYTLLLSNPASSNAEKASADNTSAHCITDKFIFSFVGGTEGVQQGKERAKSGIEKK